jgi:hypothetical protein
MMLDERKVDVEGERTLFTHPAGKRWDVPKWEIEIETTKVMALDSEKGFGMAEGRTELADWRRRA